MTMAMNGLVEKADPEDSQHRSHTDILMTIVSMI